MFCRQPKAGCTDRLLELRGVAGADDGGGDQRIAQQPGQRDLGHRLAMLAADCFGLVEQFEVLLGEETRHAPIVAAAGVVGHLVPAAMLAGQKAQCQWTVGYDGQTFFAHQPGQLALEPFAVDQVVIGLYALVGCQLVLVAN